MFLTPPTNKTLLISLLFAVFAILGQFVQMVSSSIPISMFWLAIIGYVVLLLGNVIRGM